MLSAVGADPPVMETEEINALASLLQVHDPRLSILELKAQLRQDQPQRRKRRVGLRRVRHIANRSSANRTRTPCPRAAHCRSSRCR
jgi:hypothetical protein